MSSKKFFQSKTALITLIAASIVVIISLGVRQTFGLFYLDFSTDLDISITHFGFAIGLQLFLWGLFGPLFGIITDKYGGNVAIFRFFILSSRCLFILYRIQHRIFLYINHGNIDRSRFSIYSYKYTSCSCCQTFSFIK